MKFKTELKLDKKFDVNKPPVGAWIEADMEQIVLGAKTTNWKSMLAMLIIVLALTASFIVNSRRLGDIGSAMTPFLLIVHIIFSAPFFLMALMALGGKVVVILTNDKCEIFRGIGQLGIRKIVDLNTLSIEKRNFMIKREMKHEWELKSNKKAVLTKSGIFSFLEEDVFMYLIKSIQKIVQDKDKFLSEDLSEHLV